MAYGARYLTRLDRLPYARDRYGNRIHMHAQRTLTVFVRIAFSVRTGNIIIERERSFDEKEESLQWLNDTMCEHFNIT